MVSREPAFTMLSRNSGRTDEGDSVAARNEVRKRICLKAGAGIDGTPV